MSERETCEMSGTHDSGDLFLSRLIFIDWDPFICIGQSTYNLYSSLSRFLNDKDEREDNAGNQANLAISPA